MSRNALLQPLIIHRKPFLDILMKPLGCPTAKASRHLGLYTIAQGDNHIKIIVQNTALHLAFTFLPNCQEILYPQSVIRKKFCHFLMTAIRKTVLHMLDS